MVLTLTLCFPVSSDLDLTIVNLPFELHTPVVSLTSGQTGQTVLTGQDGQRLTTLT